MRSAYSIGPSVRKPGDLPSLSLLLLLLLLLLLTYPLSMLLVELLPPLHHTSFLLVMLKYVAGTSHHLLVPIGILVVRSDLRGIVVDIYRWEKLSGPQHINVTNPFQFHPLHSSVRVFY